MVQSYSAPFFLFIKWKKDLKFVHVVVHKIQMDIVTGHITTKIANMAKLQKIETDSRYYEYELSESEWELYQEFRERFWDEVDVEWEFVGDHQGQDEIELID